MKNQRREIGRQHINPRLRTQSLILGVIFLIILGISLYRIVIGDITLSIASLGLIIGIIIGIATSRMVKILWNEENEKVISEIDKIGVIFLIIYIVIEIGRKWFFGHWLEGAQLSVFCLIFLAGTLLGRLLSTIKSIRKILVRENKI